MGRVVTFAHLPMKETRAGIEAAPITAARRCRSLRPEAASGCFVDLFLREARGRGIAAHDGLALLE